MAGKKVEAPQPDEADVTHFDEDDDPESLVGDEVDDIELEV